MSGGRPTKRARNLASIQDSRTQTSLLSFFDRKIVKKRETEENSIALTRDILVESSSSGFDTASTSKEEPPIRACPWYKRVHGTPYVVDAFCYGYMKNVQIYFLSHYHYDHYRGLSRNFKRQIYCGEETSNLLKHCLKIQCEFIEALPLDRRKPLPDGSYVTLLDAYHCPGAVMFFFELPDGRRILHTGDLRAEKSVVWSNKLVDVDLMYLDTTYCDPTYVFPDQREIIEKTQHFVANFLRQNDRILVCVGTYTIGKEKIFEALADSLDCSIYVSPSKRQILLCLGKKVSQKLTTNPQDTKLHVISMNQLDFQTLEDYLVKYNKQYKGILAIKPTGWTFKQHKENHGLFKISKKNHVTVVGVPYSEHSSFDELKFFVQNFRPKRVIPTVFNNPQDLKRINKIVTSWLGENCVNID